MKCERVEVVRVPQHLRGLAGSIGGLAAQMAGAVAIPDFDIQVNHSSAAAHLNAREASMRLMQKAMQPRPAEEPKTIETPKERVKRVSGECKADMKRLEDTLK